MRTIAIVHDVCAEVHVWLMRLQTHCLSPLVLDASGICALLSFAGNGGQAYDQAGEGTGGGGRVMFLVTDRQADAVQLERQNRCAAVQVGVM